MVKEKVILQINGLTPVEIIQSKIYLIRGRKVMLDQDLAELYGTDTGRLKEQVRRNIKRFPSDFLFELTRMEVNSLRPQIAALKRGKHLKYLPYAFTEQGIAMLSSVLHSERAVQVNIQIMRVFVMLKEMLLSHKDLARKIEDLERKFQGKFSDQDKKINLVFDAIKELLQDKEEKMKKKGPMGFVIPKA